VLFDADGMHSVGSKRCRPQSKIRDIFIICNKQSESIGYINKMNELVT